MTEDSEYRITKVTNTTTIKMSRPYSSARAKKLLALGLQNVSQEIVDQLKLVSEKPTYRSMKITSTTTVVKMKQKKSIDCDVSST